MATACDPLLGGEGCQQLWVSADEELCLANASVTCGAVSQRLSNCSAPDDVGGGWGIFVSILCDIFISVGLALQVRVAAARERVFALPISTSLFTSSLLRKSLHCPHMPDALCAYLPFVCLSSRAEGGPQTCDRAGEGRQEDVDYQAAHLGSYQRSSTQVSYLSKTRTLPLPFSHCLLGALPRRRVQVLGLIGMISGEVGNLAAYGDRGTPTAVITAVGCVGKSRPLTRD